MVRARKEKPIKLVRKRLDDAAVEAHFRSVATDAQAIEIRLKGAATDYSGVTTAQLEEAGRLLLAGEHVAVQIRFFRDDAWWCDTVTRAVEGFRLVRMRSDPHG